MPLAETALKHLRTMRFVERVSRSLQTTSWVLGGYTADIHIGRILREHDDLDYLTLNLHALKSEITEAFLICGWQAKNLVNGDLSLKREGVKVHLGNVELNEVATWTHHGEKGSLIFPVSWLSAEAVEFCGMELHVVEPELQYVLKEHPELLNPDWMIRDKDIFDKEYLQYILVRERIDVCSLHELVISI